MKKLITFLLTLVMLTVSVSAVDLYIDTEKIETEAAPVIVDGRTLVPMRTIFESLGVTVVWDQSTKTSTGTKGNIEIVIQANSPTAYVNRTAQTLDVPAQLINGYMMVPARFIAETFDCNVSWYSPAQVVAIADELKNQPLYTSWNGTLFHASNSCEAGTHDATLAEVIGRGLKSCSKCVPVDIDFSSRLEVAPEPPVTVTPETPATNTSDSQTTKPSTQTTTPSKSGTTAVTPSEAPTQNQSRTVYVTKTGKRYHYNSHCNGGRYYESTLDAAIKRGLTPCQKCT